MVFNKAGKSQAKRYFEGLDKKGKIQALKLFKRMADFGKIHDKTKFRNEGDKVYAFKPQPDRFLSFFSVGNLIILTNAFEKKSKKLPKNEKDIALKAIQDFNERNLKGEYYEAEKN